MQPWIQTACGIKFDYEKPTPEMIDIRDIAIALSRLPRFAGHTLKFYSVAQHSAIVSWIIEDAGGSRYQQMLGLLHDAPEAYIGDMTAPLKQLVPQFREIEARVWEAVYRKFFDAQPLAAMPECVKTADAVALRFEAIKLFNYEPIDNWVERLPMGCCRRLEPLNEEAAWVMFCDRFAQLFGTRVGELPEQVVAA